jgi:uncharacterized membrane protein YfcA
MRSMDTSTLLILLLIGFAAGLLGGFVGIGGGIIIVPALVYFLGLTEHQAIGTSIAVMLPPIGIMAAMNFYRAGDLNITYAIVVASAFVLGGYFGSKMSLALKDSVHIVKLVFGSVMLYAALRMIWAAVKVMIAK